MKEKYAYYPGCSALKSATELDLATRVILNDLEIPWKLLDQAACCGSRECGGLKVEDEYFALANNARTFAMAEEFGASTILNVCSTCQLELTQDNQRLKNDQVLQQRINSALKNATQRIYSGSVRVKNLLHILVNDFGIEYIKERVNHPLEGLRLAPFYGCHLLRPSNVHRNGDDPLRPRSLGVLFEAVGAEEVWFDGATKCCGFHSILVEPKVSLSMSGNHLIQAEEAQADFIVTPCPLCFTVLDGYQSRIRHVIGNDVHIPVLHLSQLIGLALGRGPQELGMQKHMENPLKVLEKFNIR